MSLITTFEDSLNGLLDDNREECILAFKNKWNHFFFAIISKANTQVTRQTKPNNKIVSKIKAKIKRMGKHL
jgi:hypothetical protein